MIRSTWLHSLVCSLIETHIDQAHDYTPLIHPNQSVQIIKHHDPLQGKLENLHVQLSDTQYWCEAILSVEAQQIHHL